MKKLIILFANSQRYFIHVLRGAVFILLLWIAMLKFFSCGAHGSVVLTYLSAALWLISGAMTLAGMWFYKAGLIGGLLTSVISLVALIIAVFPGSCTISILSMSYLLLIPAGLICMSDCAKQIFREYVLRMGK